MENLDKIGDSLSEGNNQGKQKKVELQDLVIYTSTLYGNDEVSQVREKLALKLFSNADQLGIRCVVLDGGSNENFINEAKKFSNIEMIVDPSLGMGEGRRAALKTALGKKEASFFLWLEPEKDDLVNEKELSKMIAGLREGSADIIVPRRESRDTMPEFQAWIENRANERAMEIAGVSKEETKDVWDLWFGPKMFNREGAKYFSEYKGKMDNWDSIIKPVLDAYQDGKKISSVDVDFKYDISQKQNEENNREMKMKRIFQYTKILVELGDDFWQKKEKENRGFGLSDFKKR